MSFATLICVSTQAPILEARLLLHPDQAVRLNSAIACDLLVVILLTMKGRPKTITILIVHIRPTLHSQRGWHIC